VAQHAGRTRLPNPEEEYLAGLGVAHQTPMELLPGPYTR